MSIFDKIKNRSYWISTLVIVLSVMLFEASVSNFILKYISNIPNWLLSFVSIIFIITVTRLLSEEILEI